MTSERALTEFP